MRIDSFSVDEYEECLLHSQELESENKSLLDSTYVVKSNIGIYTVFSFADAVHLAKQIFGIQGCWALIKMRD